MRIIELAKRSADLLAFLVLVRENDALGAGQSAQADRLGGESSRGVEARIQLGNCSAIGVNIQKGDRFPALVCQNGNQNGHHRIESAHFSGIHIGDVFALQTHGRLESLIGSDAIRSEIAVLLDLLRGAQRCHHSSIRGFVCILEFFQFDGVVRSKGIFDDLITNIQGTTTAAAKECRTDHYHSNVVPSQSSHVQFLLNKIIKLQPAVFVLWFCTN